MSVFTRRPPLTVSMGVTRSSRYAPVICSTMITAVCPESTAAKMIEIDIAGLFTYAVIFVACAFLAGYYWGFQSGWKAWKKRGVPPEDQ